MPDIKKDSVAIVLIDAFRSGVFTTIGIVAILTGFMFENNTIFGVGIAAAFALASLKFLQKLFHRYPRSLVHFIGSFIGGSMPPISFAFISAKFAIIIATGFSLFLVFITNSTALEKKTFKDGARAAFLVLIQVILCYLVGSLLSNAL